MNGDPRNYKPWEDLDEETTRRWEASNREPNIRPFHEEYGSVEHLDKDTARIMQAQVEEQRRIDKPFLEYLNDLIQNPVIDNNIQFDNAVIRSMESNRVMKNFTEKLVDEISDVVYGFTNINKSDYGRLNLQKDKLEKLVEIYVRYLYGLKNNNWSFNAPSNFFEFIATIPEETIERISYIQKNYNLLFTMPIPKNLGDYGNAFERKGRMSPSITFMYDDLKNVQVNWHQVLIYKLNELTPHQKFLQRQEEQMKQRELERQEKMKNSGELVQNLDDSLENNMDGSGLSM